MADINDLAQRLAFLQSGGKDPGNSNADQFNQGYDQVNKVITDVLAKKKAVLENNKTVQETTKIAGENTPLADVQYPITKEFMTRDANTPQATIDAQDALTAKRAAVGSTTLAQGKELASIENLKAKEIPKLAEDERPATDIYTPAYIKQIFPNVPDAERAKIKVGQVKAGITTNNQSTLNDDRDLARKNLEEDRTQRQQDRQTNMRTQVVNRFNSQQNTKKYQSAIDAADNVVELISSNNPIADNAVPTYMARASGEVGNLSEADKRPFGGNQAILTRMQQAVTQAASGKLTPENREFVRQLANTMKTSALKNMDNAARKFSKQQAGVGGYGKEDEIYTMLNSGYSVDNSTGSASGLDDQTTQKIQTQLPAGAKIKSIKRIQ